jgi:UDP-N-acetyl-D-mannosaminuronic acid transferase (WecB/TagA/CpsF family)
VDAAIGRARENRGFRLFTLNLDHLVKRRDDSAFREAYERADFVTADGAPVRYDTFELTRLYAACRNQPAGSLTSLATPASR